MSPQKIFAQARTLLLDVSPATWADADFLKFLNDARDSTYSVRPDLFEATETLTLAAGARQTLPSNASRLFRPIRNVSHKNKRHITVVAPMTLAMHRPNWRSEKQSAEILHVLYDEKDGNQYEVYPPALAGVTIEMSYAKPPTDITSASDNSELPEGTESVAYIDYVIARAMMVESNVSASMVNRAAGHMQIYQSKLGIGAESKGETSPNR